MNKKTEKKTNAMRILDRGNYAYTMLHYESEEGIDGLSVAAKIGEDPSKVYKTLVARGDRGSIYVFVIPVAAELDLKKCARAVGEKKIEMIHVRELKDLTGYIRGGCSPIGMKKQYPTVIDDAAKDLPEIIFSGGKIGAQIRTSVDILIKASGGRLENIVVD